MKKYLLRTLFFIPTILVTLIITWIFIFPNFCLLEMPLILWCMWAAFFISSFLLSYGRFYGGIVALIIPIVDYIYSLSGYAGYRHVDTLPYIVGLSIFYVICGMIVYVENKR